MNILRFATSADLLEKQDSYVIIDNFRFKHISFLKTKETVFVIEGIKKTVTREALLESCQDSNLDRNKVVSFLIKLINNNVVYESFFPEGFIYANLEDYDLLENYFDSRFGRLIASFESQETETVNRFDMIDNMKRSHLCIIGIGTLGSLIAIISQSLNLGEITIIDGDVVEESNLTRQYFYFEDQIGKNKVDCLKEYISRSNSTVNVNAICRYIDSVECANELMNNSFDLIIQTGDHPRGEINSIVNLVSVKKRIPVMYITNGAIGPFYIPGFSSCFNCWMKTLEEGNVDVQKNIIDAAKNTNSRNVPAAGYDQMILISYIIDDIFSFLGKKTIPVSCNHIITARKPPRATHIEKIQIINCEVCRNV